MIGSIRETKLVAPLIGAASMTTVLLATAGCIPSPFGSGDLLDSKFIEIVLPPSPVEVSLVAALRPVTLPSDEAVALGSRPPVPPEKPGPMLTVAPGDTLDKISTRHGVPARTIIALNGLSHPYWLKTGQRLELPHEALRATPAVEAEAQVVATPEAEVEAAVLTPPTPPAKRSTHLSYAELASSSTVTRSDTSDVPLPPTRNTFLWPTEGQLISGFGVKPGGMHNDGINVAVPIGSEIRAAKNGVVAYAGNELRGYGNLVLIRHEDGWMTAYAHNDSLLVEKGDVVRRGQVISHSGRTGRVDRPQAHFEIRRNGKPKDPLRLFTRK